MTCWNFTLITFIELNARLLALWILTLVLLVVRLMADLIFI